MKQNIITNNEKINYIRHFICRNINKINFIKKIEPFEFELEYESEDEFITVTELESE